MSTNEKRINGRYLAVVADSPSNPASGALARYGSLVGVAVVTAAGGLAATIDFGPSVYTVNVKGTGAAGAQAVPAGTTVYFHDGQTYLDANPIGGYAAGQTLTAVLSGATTATDVTIGRVGVGGGADIAAGEITPDKLGLRVVNETGVTISQDALVYVAGYETDDGLPSIALADADGAAALRGAPWVVTADILDEGLAIVVKSALSAATLNTNAGNVGDPVYLSATPGGWTLTAPTGADARVQVVGRIVVKSATVGQILWLIETGPRTVGTTDIQAAAVIGSRIGFFESAEQTGNGSSQNVAHGLGRVPTLVWIVPTKVHQADDTFVKGSVDGTNVACTVSASSKYVVFAI